jgi:hypothetical protein
MNAIDQCALTAKNNQLYENTFIKQQEGFILQAAYKATGHYITKSDDQWSISLSAFHEAVRSYSMEKGAFLSFAQLIIKRRLFDEYKRQAKHRCEVSFNPCSLENDADGNEEDVVLKREIMAVVVSNQDNPAKLEIEALADILKEYGFSFADLVKVSPKSAKTKTLCAKAIAYMVNHTELCRDMTQSKELPLKIIVNNLKLPRKTLERHRKYIIAGIEIVCGDFPLMKEYLHFVREELK